MSKTFTIGRDPSADIPIADASVSRIHAEAVLDDGGQVFLTDCNSSNGTFILRDGKEQRVSQERLLATDQIKFGGVSLPVTALIAAIRRKDPRPEPAPMPSADSPASIDKPPPKKKGVREFSESTRLVRCACGAVKPAASVCATCGL
ncbi:MAG: FHA domain-containing protein [Bryobacteraceae bacterium]